jgi:ABC-type antimicrobial peptide transport system permease subunit
MTQSRRQSIIETVAGVAIGFAVSIGLSYIVYPIFGHSFTIGQNIGITVIFTIASIARGYLVRRVFNRIHSRARA